MSEPEAQRTLVISRTFEAPPNIVFKAYSAPEHIKKWFGPVTYPVTTAEMDFRVGGRWRFVMTGPDGQEGPPFGGTYLEIEEGKRLVYDNRFLDDRGFTQGTMVTTVTFEPLEGGKTLLVMTTVFESRAERNKVAAMGFIEGCGSGFDQLGDLVKTLAA